MPISRFLLAAVVGLVLPIAAATADAATPKRQLARPARVSTATYQMPRHTTHRLRASLHRPVHVTHARAIPLRPHRHLLRGS